MENAVNIESNEFSINKYPRKPHGLQNTNFSSLEVSLE